MSLWFFCTTKIFDKVHITFIITKNLNNNHLANPQPTRDGNPTTLQTTPTNTQTLGSRQVRQQTGGREALS